MGVVEGSDLARVAEQLDFALRHAITRQGNSNFRLPAGAEADALKAIAQLATALLEALGFNADRSRPDPNYEPGAGQLLVSLRNHIQFRKPVPCIPEISAAGSDEIDPLMLLSRDDLLKADDDRRQRQANALEYLPQGLHTLMIQAADAAAVKRGKSQRGRRRDDLADLLIARWILAAELATGKIPQARIKGEVPDPRTVEALRSTIRLAVERLRSTTRPDLCAFSSKMHPLSRLSDHLNALRGLSDQRLAHLIEAAARTLRNFRGDIAKSRA
jgi:hypothetical protein